jgi:hypothetical protein
VSSEAKQEQPKEWQDAVGVFIVREDGKELLMHDGNGTSSIAPGYRPELAIAAAKQIAKEGAKARVLRFSAREVLFEALPTPEDAAKLKSDLAERERKVNAELAATFECLASALRKEKPEAK